LNKPHIFETVMLTDGVEFQLVNDMREIPEPLIGAYRLAARTRAKVPWSFFRCCSMPAYCDVIFKQSQMPQLLEEHDLLIGTSDRITELIAKGRDFGA
jgi:hypothetical protein